ncbi:MAG: cupredoxin domain-containing protein [Candidatus Jorgensenbacteria bacterium]|nr:cupredoxin domain-containing protein [Candidatus Jorgensenbacteria bacterium]
MEENNSKAWIVIGVVGAIAIIYFAVWGSNSKSPTTPNNGTVSGTQTATKNTLLVPLVPGASPVSETGKVVTQNGAPVKLNAVPGTQEAPQQSNSISEKQLPSKAIKLSVSTGGFLPATFSVSAGNVITLAISSTDEKTHVFKFDDPSLSAVAMGIGPNETRAITFNAPARGTYTFHCDVPNHGSERGTMVVQ